MNSKRFSFAFFGNFRDALTAALRFVYFYASSINAIYDTPPPTGGTDISQANSVSSSFVQFCVALRMSGIS